MLILLLFYVVYLPLFSSPLVDPLHTGLYYTCAFIEMFISILNDGTVLPCYRLHFVA